MTTSTNRPLALTDQPDTAALLRWQVVAVIATTVLVRILGSYAFPVYDDAFITYRYASNLVHTGAFVYNPNEFVMGTTSPLFGLLVSMMMWVHLPIPIAVVMCNIALDAAIAWLLMRRFLPGVDGFGAFLALICVAASPLLVRITVGGMESNLFLAGILVALYLYRNGRALGAVAVASMLYFIRPESVLLVGFLIVHELIDRHMKRAIVLGLVSLLVVAPGLYLLYRTYGSFVPQSVQQKSQVHASVFEVFRQLVVPNVTSFGLLVLAVLGIRRWKGTSVLLRDALLFAGVYLAAYLLMRPSVWSWYTIPIQTVLAIGAGFGLRTLFAWLPGSARKRAERIAWYAVPALVIIAWIGIAVQSRSTNITRGIYLEVDRWAQAAHPEHATILAGDIGAIGYYSNARMFDAGGLVTPLSQSLRADLGAMIDTSHADYLFLTATEDARPILEREPYRSRYRLVRRFSARDTSVGSLVLSNAWVQDYLLFERRPGSPIRP